MTDRALHITLGHNSSAALSLNGHLMAAYEQERIDRKKGSSEYPRDAIRLAMGDIKLVDVAYVGHWFDDTRLRNNKYLDLDHLRSVARNIVGLTDSFTHHDSHASSAMSFFRSNGAKYHDADIFVLDGFGTRQECFSVYQSNWPAMERPRLVHRTYGYSNSLGLMYQYTTEYLGLKPNQDEYKLLGYESHVLAYARRQRVATIRNIVIAQAEKHAAHMLTATAKPAASGSLIDYEALKQAKAKWWACADQWRSMFDVRSDMGVRACVAFCAQTFIEACATALVRYTLPGGATSRAAVVLTGGCHYNVKLNRRIQIETRRRVMSHPLAGDQGAAMGFTPGLSCREMTLGRRDLTGRDELPFGVEVVPAETWSGIAAKLIRAGRIVNVVRGDMEFGPRALCNTTTFALPTQGSVRRINALNERDESMPMAPVMTRTAAMRWLDNSELRAVSPSDRFMITTCAFAGAPPARLLGVAHKDPLVDVWTARPQVVSDGAVRDLLLEMPDETLINTSFNYHGEPIVYSQGDAIRTHEMQCFRAQQLGLGPPVTLLVRQ